MNSLTTADIKIIMARLQVIMSDNRDYLISLDSVMGDGDLGITMTRAFDAAAAEAGNSSETNPGKLLMQLGMAMAKAAPSTMGTLMATGFMRGGKAIAGIDTVGIRQFAEFLQAFTNGIMERGKSKPGNKTIIDVLHPAAEALSLAANQNKSLSEGLSAASIAAAKGLEDSKQMKAQYGRAAYYQDDSVGKQDPGATVGVLFLKGFIP